MSLGILRVTVRRRTSARRIALDFNLSRRESENTRPREDRHLSVGRGAIFVVFIPISSRQTWIHNSAADNQRDVTLRLEARLRNIYFEALSEPATP